MNSQQRQHIIESLQVDEKQILVTKGREYTAGAENDNESDALHNFKSVAKKTGVTTLQVWNVFFSKHIESIDTYIKDPSRDLSEPIDGRILDARVYLGLLQCLIVEARDEVERQRNAEIPF